MLNPQAMFGKPNAQNPTLVGNKFVMKPSSQGKHQEESLYRSTAEELRIDSSHCCEISLPIKVTMGSAMEHKYSDVHLGRLCWKPGGFQPQRVAYRSKMITSSCSKQANGNGESDRLSLGKDASSKSVGFLRLYPRQIPTQSESRKYLMHRE